MNPQLEQLIQDFEEGDATAALPIADLLQEEGHESGAELGELALMMANETDWTVVMLATANFSEILKGVK